MKQENRNATFLSVTCKRVRAFRNASAQLLLPFSRQIKNMSLIPISSRQCLDTPTSASAMNRISSK
jgi:hypothetical protein